MNALEYAGLLAINSVEFPGSMRSRRAFFCKDHQLTLDVYDGDTSADGLVALFFYGGNWQSGHRSQYRFVGRHWLDWVLQRSSPIIGSGQSRDLLTPIKTQTRRLIGS